jgi:putative ABC transport system permease protein
MLMREPLRALWRHKLRSALSVLGILIGVAVVVWVVAIGQAGTRRAADQLAALGDNLVWIEAGGRNVNGVRTGTRDARTLTLDDGLAVQREIRFIKAMTPNVDGRLQVAHGNRNWTTGYRGVNGPYLEIKKFRVARGALWTEAQEVEAASVVVIGETVRNRLFGAEEPLGAPIRVQGTPFEVIGVLEPKGMSADGRDQDDTVLMPYAAAVRKLRGKGGAWLDDILCSATAPELVNPAIDRVTLLLRERHGIRPGQEDDFNIRRPDEVMKAQLEASSTLARFLLTVASISLLVGGIGVMNVMLASVAQRTREIGLRLALGATPAAVRVQFLGEAIMLTFGGGLAGVAVSWGGGALIGRALGWPLALSVQAVSVALAFAIGVGLVFGAYPAWRASSLDPIDALRHE